MTDLKQLARDIFLRAIEDCSIERALDRVLRVSRDAEGTHLLLDGQRLANLDRLKHVRVLSIGKAATPMLQALLRRLPLPASCELEGVLIAVEPPPKLPATIQYFAGGHPYPNAASFAGASAALSMLHASASADNTLCLFLISGGASAMMELPLDPAISLDDTVAFHRALVGSGASIVEMNCVRKHFSAVKGGRLAVAAGNARKLSLLVSDVPPAHLDALASGPTLADPTSVAQCREILARSNLLERLPPSVRDFFTSPNLPETPKPADLDSPICKLLDSDGLAKAAQHHATDLGFHAVVDNSPDDWAYDAAANYLLNRLRHLRRQHPRVCLISVGEVAVRLPSSAGAGGRNQHLALSLATQLREDDAPIAILSAGSDGIDGNSPAAGAVLDHAALADPTHRASALHALATFDAYPWLSAAGATIVTGPTGQNLRDLRILLADSEP